MICALPWKKITGKISLTPQDFGYICDKLSALKIGSLCKARATPRETVSASSFVIVSSTCKIQAGGL